MHRHITPLVLLLGASALALGGQTSTDQATPGGLGAAAPAEQADSGRPWLHMGPAREIRSEFKGPERAVAALRAHEAKPLSLATADFDEDGMPDVVSGFKLGRGGVITLHRGNVHAIYPNTAEAKERRHNGKFTDAAFLPDALAIETPDAPDFLGAGDFDADGHWDVVAASRTKDRLQWHRGDGKGGFGPAQAIAIAGRPTALVTGEINRRDGLEDVVVAVAGPAGPEALVFEAPEGALRREPERFSLPAPATALVLGQADDEYAYDLLMAAKDSLMYVQGRDRRLSLDEVRRTGAKAARMTRVQLPFELSAVALGDFDADRAQDAALLTASGALYVAPVRSLLDAAGNGRLSQEALGAPQETQATGAALLKVNASSLRGDDLLVVDRGARRVVGVLPDRRLRNAQRLKADTLQAVPAAAEASAQQPVTIPVDGEPLAILPMRLDSNALDDLVVLASESASLSVIPTPQSTIFHVINVDDSGPGSLRQAILDANVTGGADSIHFSIPGPPPHVIVLDSWLPDITDSVTIDGTTEPDFTVRPVVELDGTAIEVVIDGLAVYAPNTTIRGLVIRNFHRADPTNHCDGWTGIALYAGADRAIVEGNFLGSDATGMSVALIDDGITVGAFNCRIGGTVAEAGNLITASGCRSVALFTGASGTVVQGNLLGTNLSGNALLGPGGTLQVWSGANTTIGGTTAGARNVIISGELHSPSVSIRGIGTSGHLVQGNYLGIDAAGASMLGNGGQVNIVAEAADNTIGGTTPAARNVIGGAGPFDIGSVWMLDRVSGTLVQGNFIGTDATGTASLGTIGNGVAIHDASGNTIGGSVPGAGNVISGKSRNGVHIAHFNELDSTDNLIAGNRIGTNASGTAAIPNALNGIFLETVTDSTIGGSTVDSRNVIAGNGGDGIRFETGGLHIVRGNYIGTNAAGTAAIPNAGDGILLFNAIFNQIGGPSPGDGNLISGNNLAGMEISGFGGSQNTVQGNLIGTDVTGLLDLGNVFDGIRLSGPASDNRIEGNAIAYNDGGGILAFGTGANLFLANTIFSNATLGIDLEGDGVTDNDPGDTDTGSNELQNFPVITGVTTTGGNIIVNGTLDAPPFTSFQLDFFASPACDPSGHGEGRTFLGSRPLMTDVSGPTGFFANLPVSVAAGQAITATASGGGQGTSEFSPCFIAGGVPPSAVTGVEFESAVPETLAWDAVPGATGYHVYVGTRATLSGLSTQAADACEAAVIPEPEGTLPPGSNPPPGQMIWFLFTAQGPYGEGPLQPGNPLPRQLNSVGGCGDSCAHGSCDPGVALEPACTLCTSIICEQDPKCCDPVAGAWDFKCVQEMRTICRSLTCGESQGQCAQPLCDVGGPLVPGCDTPPLPVSCTAKVCQADPHCCQQAWDEACIDKMESLCGYNCI